MIDRVVDVTAGLGLRTLVAVLGMWAALGAPAAGQARSCCLEIGLDVAGRFRVPGLDDRRFDHDRLWASLAPVVASPELRTEEIGRSIEGRPIRAVSFGHGPVTVLLWSQMHGDESTATMALADLLHFFAAADADGLRNRLRDALTVVAVPMLNPDGAARFERVNAIGVDVNRDARRLATPEGRALKQIRDRLQPDFGFNLHDQGARTLAGPEGEQVALAFLPPAADAARSYGAGRRRARLVAATIVAALAPQLRGRMAKYDDTFNPRAFGDLIQTWGTSAVLIESGALPDDPQKQRLRAYNVAAILTALEAIATRGYEDADPQAYESLPFNHRIANDVLLVGGSLVIDGRPIPVDVAVTYDDPVARTGPRVREVGDLEGQVALDTLDVSGLYLHRGGQTASGRLERGAPAWFLIRRGPSADAEVVLEFGNGGDERR